MRTRDELRERREYFEECIRGWAEPDGLLVPTEPDPDERALIRARLRAGADVLTWALVESEAP